MEPSPFELAEALPSAFFDRPTEDVARDLLGKVLLSRVGDVTTGGLIVETEAYLGSDDPGSHAATKGVTPRNRVMYGLPAHAYVYFTYGTHHMLNLVTEARGVAGAVLIRAIEPMIGVDVMSARRGGKMGPEISNGPGKVAQALGIGLVHNGRPLGSELAVYGTGACPGRVGRSGRVGLSAGHDLPLRFYLVDNGYVSKGKTGPRPKKRRSDPRIEEMA
jgi:DNA-3-methyladenine glycosylase